MVASVLHWLMAGLIIFDFLLGGFKAHFSACFPAVRSLFVWHKWVGITIFLLLIIRIFWRITHPVPPLPKKMHSIWHRVSHTGHMFLYLLMLVVPLSGYFYSAVAGRQVVYFGLLPLPRLITPDPVLQPVLKNVHFVLDYMLLALIFLHVAAVICHRMTGGQRLLARISLSGKSWCKW